MMLAAVLALVGGIGQSYLFGYDHLGVFKSGLATVTVAALIGSALVRLSFVRRLCYWVVQMVSGFPDIEGKWIADIESNFRIIEETRKGGSENQTQHDDTTIRQLPMLEKSARVSIECRTMDFLVTLTTDRIDSNSTCAVPSIENGVPKLYVFFDGRNRNLNQNRQTDRLPDLEEFSGAAVFTFERSGKAFYSQVLHFAKLGTRAQHRWTAQR